MKDSRGRSKSVENNRTDPPNIKSTGTNGYPVVWYGRYKSGRFFRRTSTAAAVMQYRIQLANITRLNRSSYFPESTNNDAQALNTRIETPGVWYFGLTRPMAEKKYPCRAAA